MNQDLKMGSMFMKYFCDIEGGLLKAELRGTDHSSII